MKRCLTLVSLRAVLAALAAAAARAYDAGVAATMIKWSLRIPPKGSNLSAKVTGSTTPDQALSVLRSFTIVSRRGAVARGATNPSSAAGDRLEAIVQQSFPNFANAGALLTRAVQMVKAGKNTPEIGILVDRAVKLAIVGGGQLETAGTLVPKLAT